MSEAGASGRSANVDLSVYSLEAVLKSAYRFSGRCYLVLRTVDERTVHVDIRPKQPEDSADAVMGEFLNDLIDQRLRSRVAAETAVVRDRIMAHALSQSGFIRPDLESADATSDSATVSVRPETRARS